MSKPNLDVESRPFRLSELLSALLKTDCCHTLIMALASSEGKMEEEDVSALPVLKGRWRTNTAGDASSEGKMEATNHINRQF